MITKFFHIPGLASINIAIASLVLLGTPLLAKQARQSGALRITNIGMSTSFGQMDGCFLRALTGDNVYWAYGEIDIKSGTIRIGVNDDELIGSIDLRSGQYPRTGSVGRIRYTMTPFSLREQPYQQFTTLTITSASGRASRRLRVECNN